MGLLPEMNRKCIDIVWVIITKKKCEITWWGRWLKHFQNIRTNVSLFQCVHPWNKQAKNDSLLLYQACSTLPSLDNIDANIQCSMHASTDTKIDRTLLTLRWKTSLVHRCCKGEEIKRHASCTATQLAQSTDLFSKGPKHLPSVSGPCSGQNSKCSVSQGCALTVTAKAATKSVALENIL